MADAMNAISQSMECSVCLSTFTDPKILPCSHTFCKTCLDNLLECQGNCQIRCPVCRAVTQVPNQDVGKLQVNLALKSLIEDMKGHPQICTNCKSDDKPHAVVYCQDCGRFLCTSCLNKHSQWEGFIDHEVIAMSEISSGKVSVRRYRKCRKHPKEDEDYFCSTCRRFTCFRCGMMEHKDEGHQVIDGAAYENKHMKSIEDLKSKVDKKRSCFQKYIDLIDEQRENVDDAKKQCTSDINKAYDEVVRQLTKKRESLLREVKERTEGVEKELESMKTTAQKHIDQLTTIAEMVTNRTKIPLDMDTLASHDTLCEELQEAFDRDDPDYEQPRKSSKKGGSVFFERDVGMDDLDLGNIANIVVKNVALPIQDSMNTMVSTPDGRMAVGCSTGGINIFSPGGKLQQTVLKDVKIRGVGFFSDGRCVVIDGSCNISQYTPWYEKMEVKFETKAKNEDEDEEDLLNGDYDDVSLASSEDEEEIEGGNRGEFDVEDEDVEDLLDDDVNLFAPSISSSSSEDDEEIEGGNRGEFDVEADVDNEDENEDEGIFSGFCLTVDNDDDLIYVGHCESEKILVFSTAGGQTIREIPCNGYAPQQFTSCDGSLLTSSDDTIRLIGKDGAVQHELSKPGSDLYAAVSQWNTILIANVEDDEGEGLVSIDEYTNELRHIRNLVNDYKIEKPEREWYYLQQYRSGEIAFCTSDRLYIFN